MSGFTNGVIGGAIGGLAGGVIGGIDALIKGTNFWTGNATFDLSSGYGASGPGIGDQMLDAKYVGRYEDVNLFEANIPKGSGVTLPGKGIILSKGQWTQNSTSLYTRQLLQHEYGHILQAKIVGNSNYYTVIAPQSLGSATFNTYAGHNNYWTETWANYLSHNYFGVNSLMGGADFPISNLRWYDWLRFIAKALRI